MKIDRLRFPVMALALLALLAALWAGWVAWAPSAERWSDLGRCIQQFEHALDKN